MTDKEIFQLYGNDSFWQLNKCLVLNIGLLEATLYAELFSWYQHFYLTDQLQEDNFFYMSKKLLYTRLGVSESTLFRCMKNLKKLGLVIMKQRGISETNLYTLDLQVLVKLLSEGERKVKISKKMEDEFRREYEGNVPS